MKHQRVTIKERFQDEYRRQVMRQPKEGNESLTPDAWFIIIALLSIGGGIGFAVGVFLV